MATRTSQSSPCFLRVADASAASSASKMISLSTPFSFETASTTIRISLFIQSSSWPSRPLRREPRASDLGKSNCYHGAIHRQINALRAGRLEPAGVAPPAVSCDLQLEPDALADEALKVRRRAQHAIHPR